jgi:hypothetical protein
MGAFQILSPGIVAHDYGLSMLADKSHGRDVRGEKESRGESLEKET